MGLEYRLTDIEAYHQVCYIGDQLNPRTDAIIRGMMFIGVGEGSITKKNVREVVRQFMVLQLVVGPLLTDTTNFEPVMLTPEDIEAHVGLWTNCFSPNINTKRAFSKFIADHLADADHVMRRVADIYPNRVTDI